MQKNSMPHLGFGLGLRPTHYPYIFENRPKVDWFEIISENFMDTEGKPRRNLARVMEHYPIVMHGVSMSIGTVDPLNSEYLKKLKALADYVKPAWISDHLAWTGVAHRNSHDLLPVPYTEEALKHIISRIREVQDYLERPIALENPSTYLEFKSSQIPEAEFIARMAEESGCNLLLDVNNVYVTCYNHRLDAKAYLDALPLHQVIQIHLSGHTNKGTHIVDTHDDYVVDEVWQLYKYVVHCAGRVPNTMVEWDDHIPEFDILNAELGKARAAAGDCANYGSLPDLAQTQKPQLANDVPPLKEAQHLMLDAVTLGHAFNSKPEAWIRAKEQLEPQQQLDVYINAYRWRLQDVIAEDYPVLKHYLGNAAFSALLKSFVDHAFPDHFNIGRYALKLPDFIKKHSNDRFAHELCVLETTIAQLADPKETSALEPDDIAALTPDVLMKSILHPRAALNLMQFSYRLNDYYRAVQEEKPTDPPKPEASYLAAFRHDDVVWRMDMDKQEFRMLQVLFSGQTVGSALEILESELKLNENDLAETLSAWFSRWMRNHLLTGIETPDLKSPAHEY